MTPLIISVYLKHKSSEAKRRAEREAYLKTPEGRAEQARLERASRELSERLKRQEEQVRVFNAAYHFQDRVNYCWKCKRRIQLPAKVNSKDTYLKYYNEIEDEERNERYKKIKEVICPSCGWVKCEYCRGCKCRSPYSNNY